MNRRSRRAVVRAELAGKLDQIAAQQRAWANDFERARAEASSRDLGRILLRAIEVAREFRRALNLDRYFDLEPELTRELESGHVPVGALADDFARRLENAGVDLRCSDHATEARILTCIARLLPARERSRFACEEKGNLGVWEHWWQRVARLAGVAIAMPSLAQMVRRERRRRRA